VASLEAALFWHLRDAPMPIEHPRVVACTAVAKTADKHFSSQTLSPPRAKPQDYCWACPTMATSCLAPLPMDAVGRMQVLEGFILDVPKYQAMADQIAKSVATARDVPPPAAVDLTDQEQSFAESLFKVQSPLPKPEWAGA